MMGPLTEPGIELFPWQTTIKTRNEEGKATHSSILAWRILWTEEPGGLQWGHKESDSAEET